MRRVSDMVADGAKTAIWCALVLQTCFAAAARAEERPALATATIQVKVKVFSDADIFNIDDCLRPGAPPECFTEGDASETKERPRERTKALRDAFERHTPEP